MKNTEKYINPFTDFGFKKLFGSEPNKDILMDFLNELLPEKHKIYHLTYSKTEYPGLHLNDRKAIFDIFCSNEQGDKFIVEIQRAKQIYFKDRSIYYSTFPIQEQAIKGDWNFKLAAVYTIAILDFVFEDNAYDDSVVFVVQLKDQNNEVFYGKLTYIYLQMPKFNKTEDELETNFEKWMFVIKNIHRLTDIPSRLQNKIFMKFFGEAEIANLAQEERVAYEQSLKVYRDLKNVTDTAFEDGIRKSELELLPKLEEERRLKEEERRLKEEEYERVAIAIKKMLSLDITIQDVAKIFNISESEVEEYLKQ